MPLSWTARPPRAGTIGRTSPCPATRASKATNRPSDDHVRWSAYGSLSRSLSGTPLLAVWNALDSFSGWPTDQRPPARALLVSRTVDEPKAIYVWLVAPAPSGVFAYLPDKAAPRAYRLPYSRELHEQVTRGTALAKAGAPRRVDAAAARDGGPPDELRGAHLPAAAGQPPEEADG
jgi:hypothetical protein